MTVGFIDPLAQQVKNRLERTQLFTADGTWTRPNGCKRIWVTMVGAGGDGQSSASNGVGGGAGAYCIDVPLAVGENLDIFCGVGVDSFIQKTSNGDEILRAKKGLTGSGANGGAGGGWGPKNLGSGAGGSSSDGDEGTDVYGNGLFFGGSGGGSGGSTYVGGGINGGDKDFNGGGSGAGDIFGRGGKGKTDPDGEAGKGFGAGGAGSDSGAGAGGTGAPGFVLIKWTQA